MDSEIEYHFNFVYLQKNIGHEFRGRKELFEGLYVYDRWDWSRKYPVIRIDWTRISHKTPEEIENLLFAIA